MGMRLTVKEARALGIIPEIRKKPAQKNPRCTAQWDAKITSDGVWLQIPFLPPSLNEWKQWHWAKQGAYKRELTKAISGLKLAMKLPLFERARVQVVYYFPDDRDRDKDNYSGKYLLDALRNAGVITDDNSKVLGLPEPEFEVDRVRPRTEIFVRRR